MAAQKQCFVLLVDVGKTMQGPVSTENPSSKLNRAKEILVTLVQNKIRQASKSLTVGVVLYGSETTANDLSEGDGSGQYENVHTIVDPRNADVEMVRMGSCGGLPRSQPFGTLRGIPRRHLTSWMG